MARVFQSMMLALGSVAFALPALAQDKTRYSAQLDIGFPVPADRRQGPYRRYNGDVIDGGQGEILARESASSRVSP